VIIAQGVQPDAAERFGFTSLTPPGVGRYAHGRREYWRQERAASLADGQYTGKHFAGWDANGWPVHAEHVGQGVHGNMLI
jgi:hypothetical protein